MNSMPADVDVNAQWHRRDTRGAIKRAAIINNSAYSSALRRGAAAFVCLSDMFEFVATFSIMRCLNIKCTKNNSVLSNKTNIYIYLFVV